jgi:hypothetical protein
LGLELEALASKLLELENRKSELERWITFLAIGDTWSGCNDRQILGVTRRGRSGIRNINSTLHVLAAATKPKLEGWGLAEGDPIIYLENNRSCGTANWENRKRSGRHFLLCSLDGVGRNSRRRVSIASIWHRLLQS